MRETVVHANGDTAPGGPPTPSQLSRAAPRTRSEWPDRLGQMGWAGGRGAPEPSVSTGLVLTLPSAAPASGRAAASPQRVAVCCPRRLALSVAACCGKPACGHAPVRLTPPCPSLCVAQGACPSLCFAQGVRRCVLLKAPVRRCVLLKVSVAVCCSRCPSLCVAQGACPECRCVLLKAPALSVAVCCPRRLP